MKKFISKNSYLVIIAGIICFILLWEAMSGKYGNDIVLPSIFSIFSELKRIIFSDFFYLNLQSSFSRCAEALFFSVFSAILLGITGFNRKIPGILFSSFSGFLKAAPVIAMIVLILIWFPKEKAPVIIAFMISFSIVYDTVVNSIEDLYTGKRELISIYHINRKNRVLYFYFPVLVDRLLGIMGSVTGLIIKTVIAGEIYSQPKYGIGSQILSEKMNLNTAGVIAWILIVVALSGIVDFLCKYLQKRLLFWKN